MLQRWLIRSVFLLPILLCVVAWTWSARHDTGLGYGGASSFTFLHTRSGAVYLGRISSNDPSWLRPPTGWRWATPGWPQAWVFCVVGPRNSWSCLGFACQHDPVREKLGNGTFLWHVTVLAVPYWSLLLLAGFLLLFIWRKTRPRKTYGAFPVVLAGEGKS